MIDADTTLARTVSALRDALAKLGYIRGLALSVPPAEITRVLELILACVEHEHDSLGLTFAPYFSCPPTLACTDCLFRVSCTPAMQAMRRIDHGEGEQ